MHQDIEKLLNAVKEKGSITEKQREIILDKAQQLGEDIAELEFLLEDIPLKKSENSKIKTKRCPHCGAMVDDLAIRCPECGTMFSEESDATEKVRIIIKETSDKISEITQSKGKIKNELIASGMKDVFEWEVDDEVTKRKINIINAFSVPFTANALIQGYMFAYGCAGLDRNNDEMNSSERQIASAWLNKAKELYKLVQSVPNPDQQTQIWLENNKSILNSKHKKNSTSKILLIVFSFVFPIIVFLGLYLLEKR